MIYLSSYVFLTAFGYVLLQSDVPPICADLKPPFNSGPNFPLCPYNKYGCCTEGNSRELFDAYLDITRELRRRNLSFSCVALVIDLLCETCSPLAGHLVDSRGSIPKFCPGSCSSIYRDCVEQIRVAVEFTHNDTATLNSLSSEERFCSDFASSSTNEDLCFPFSMLLGRRMVRNPTEETSCVCMEQVAENLRNPVVFRDAKDGSGRMFIGEQLGIVYIYKNGVPLNEPFLDISNKVLLSDFSADERGFLGLEFHPLFFRNRKFYVFYCTPNQSGGFMTRISEFELYLLDDNRADPTSERVLLEIQQPFGNHNGGELLFGDDGYLYIFTGDGGAAGDPFNNAQNRNSLLGKVLRIDVDSRTGNLSYGIPPDNPFVNDSNSRPEIYALGVRNIWRCGKDAGDRITEEGQGRIVCGDVGQGRYEELDLIVKGGNYGWRGREGNECFDTQLCGRIGPEVLPIHVYDHSTGRSITGGNFYRGCRNPNLNGYYIFGDFVSGAMFKTKETPEGWVTEDLPLCPADQCTNGLQSTKERFILSFGEDENGEVFVLSTSSPVSSQPGGKVYRIVDPYKRANPEECTERVPRIQVSVPRGIQQPAVSSGRG